MRIHSIELKHFRCFKNYRLSFTKPISLIVGANGSGKTSLLESMYVMGYGKSFRTTVTHELIAHNNQEFFIKLQTQQALLQLGCSLEKRLIKLDGQPLKTYKELVDHYRVVMVHEDDIELIRGAPECRRTFLDSAILLHDPLLLVTVRQYRKILKQRNALLSEPTWNEASYRLWTEQLVTKAQCIRQSRMAFLVQLEKQINAIITEWFADFPSVRFTYKTTEPTGSMAAWADRERATGRTLFGPHLDDISIELNGHQARLYASRGQQKLLAVLIKVAHRSLLGRSAVVLLDDFMTDFDEQRLSQLLQVLHAVEGHMIITSPVEESSLTRLLHRYEHEIITLSF